MTTKRTTNDSDDKKENEDGHQAINDQQEKRSDKEKFANDIAPEPDPFSPRFARCGEMAEDVDGAQQQYGAGRDE
ncbi:hypothetical protein [Sulfobacillus thermosulfidooxidans]|uniref:hypothetical protein n=1 Tax=Sulfobacillus thermosulfidooxidans TaxID=28034 RepID=UPI0006B53E21|nr:hypothetical protein [Sulfobacillus thermosulfidooxidans]